MFCCCDESGSQSGSGWWVYGAVWLPHDRVADFEAEAVRVRQRHNCWGEFKWNRLSHRMLDAYQDFLAAALSQDGVRFTSMVVETALLTADETRRYHGKEGRTLAYLKFMRLLLRERIDRLIQMGHPEFTVLWDQLSVSKELEAEMRSILKTDLDKSSIKHKRKDCAFRHLSSIDSRTLHLTQVADLMAGATRYAWEGEEGKNAKTEAARKAIRNQIEDWAGGSLKYEWFPADRYYCLWRWRPSKGS